MSGRAMSVVATSGVVEEEELHENPMFEHARAKPAGSTMRSAAKPAGIMIDGKADVGWHHNTSTRSHQKRQAGGKQLVIGGAVGDGAAATGAEGEEGVA